MNKLAIFITILLLLTGCSAVPAEHGHSGSLNHVPEYQKSSGFIENVLEDLDNIFAYSQYISEEKETYEVVINEATAINSDVIAWIRCEELGIDYPILHAEDNKKYLRKNIYGEEDVTGSVYLDARSEPDLSEVWLLHGHNMKDGSMFAKLPSLFKLDSLHNLSKINIYANGTIHRYKINAIVSLNAKTEALDIESINSDENKEKLIKYFLDKSVVSPIDTNSTDILLLNTCWYGASGNERFLHCIVLATKEEEV